jgi:hypothetical protein
MTTLSYDKPREFDVQKGLQVLERAYPVVASDIIYNGAATCLNASGDALPCTGAAGGNNFIGFAYRRADNATGAAGAIRVDVAKEGYIKLQVANVTDAAKVGWYVFATDDDTFTADDGISAAGGAPAAGTPIIGKVAQYIGADGFRDHGSTTCYVHFVAHDLVDGGDAVVSAA